MSPPQRDELLADYQAGVTVQAIATKFRVHRSTVSEFVRRAGLPVRESGLSAKDRGGAASLYDVGLTLAQVAEQMAVGVEAVRSAVLAEGGQTRPRGRTPRCLAQSNTLALEGDMRIRIE